MDSAMSTTSSAQQGLEYADQQQCPLFRLPLELRDEIYQYYSHDDESLEYVSGWKLELRQTCKVVANEMKGAILRTNSIAFTSALSEGEGGDYRGLTSRAGRFESLLFHVQYIKIAMLQHAANCVTDDMLEVTRKHPSLGNVWPAIFHDIKSGRHRYFIDTRHLCKDVFFVAFCDALLMTRDLAFSHKSFEELIAKAIDPSEFDTPGWRVAFEEGSHLQVLNWRPCLWSIPDDAHLQALGRFLISPEGSDTPDFVEGYKTIRWYFSVTILDIRFFNKLIPVARRKTRTIILNEHHNSVTNPEAHAEGLIPFSIENPKLRFIMRASFETNLAPSLWKCVHVVHSEITAKSIKALDYWPGFLG